MYEIEMIDLLPQDIVDSVDTVSDLIFEIYIEDNIEFFVDVDNIDVNDDLISGNREITSVVNIGEFDCILADIANKYSIDTKDMIYNIYYSTDNIDELNIFYMEVTDAKCKSFWC
jgi:hypothetical protein